MTDITINSADLKALIDEQVAEALSKQTVGYATPEQLAQAAKDLATLLNSPHPLENQALTSNPVEGVDTTIHGTANTVSVGGPTEAVPATTPTSTTAPVSAIAGGTVDPVTGGSV